MSEEQEKPKRWYKNRKSTVLLLVILCMTTFIVVLSTGPRYQDVDHGPPDIYDTIHGEIQNAVTGYAISNNGSLPILNDAYTNDECSNCSVVNISALLVANGGLMREAPDGLNLSTSGNDNCGGNTSLGCNNYGSYIWLVDTDGTVFSYCAGAGCTTNNSGYQDVWP